MTITNAAESVVASLAKRINNRHLLYYDSDGELTEILILNGRFDGFAICNQKY